MFTINLELKTLINECLTLLSNSQSTLNLKTHNTQKNKIGKINFYYQKNLQFKMKYKATAQVHNKCSTIMTFIHNAIFQW